MFLALICRRLLGHGPSYTHCCRALTLALARLSFSSSISQITVFVRYMQLNTYLILLTYCWRNGVCVGKVHAAETPRNPKITSRSTGSRVFHSSNAHPKCTILPRVPAACNMVVLSWVTFNSLCNICRFESLKYIEIRTFSRFLPRFTARSSYVCIVRQWMIQESMEGCARMGLGHVCGGLGAVPSGGASGPSGIRSRAPLGALEEKPTEAAEA